MHKKGEKSGFDPSGIAVNNGNLFGLPFTSDESKVVIIPMPWEVTVSYRDGAAKGPAVMRTASMQVDLFEEYIPDAWKLGIFMVPISKEWERKNRLLRKKAEQCIRHLEKGGSPQDKEVAPLYREINSAGHELNEWMKKESLFWLKKNKSVCVMGGEHSVSLGFMQALASMHPSYSMLHIDAHADLRNAYEGFEFSHASIQYNASKISAIDKMVLVGIRDYSEQEADRIKNSRGRITAFSDRALKRAQYSGTSWEKLCEQIIKPLSKKVYISFDIDALDPSLCPHTGTPVPGGLEFEQVFFLVDMLVKSGRTVIGFDLCEVAPGKTDDWDCIVGVRAMYRLINQMGFSQGAFRN